MPTPFHIKAVDNGGKVGLTAVQICLVTEPTAQSELFADYLRRHVACATTQIKPPRASGGLFGEKRVLILLDIDHLDESALHAWQLRAAELPDALLAAFNLRDESHAVELLSSLHLQGIFYRSDSLELICRGLKLLREGQPWMSRSLTARMLENYRRRQYNVYRPICGLTPKEIEILGLLGIGASTAWIAEHRFVSEHTIRSHLYNIFKKIGVNSRSQAADWARQNLGPPPPFDEHKPSGPASH